MLYRVLSVNSIFQDTFLLIPRKANYFLIPKITKKTKRTKILISYLVFVFFDIFVYFRDQNIDFRVFEISVNRGCLASEKCHFYKAKQAILTSKIGTIPVLKWLHSDSTKVLFQKSSNLLTKQG